MSKGEKLSSICEIEKNNRATYIMLRRLRRIVGRKRRKKTSVIRERRRTGCMASWIVVLAYPLNILFSLLLGSC